MLLRKDIDVLMERIKQFIEQGKQGSAMIQVKNIQSIRTVEPTPLNQWKFPRDLYMYLDERMDLFKSYWKARQDIDDDLIPALAPWYGIAEHSSFVGGRVDFSQSTSWHSPIIHEWDDIDKMELNEENTWFRMIIDGLYYLKKQSKGQFAIKLRGAYSPLDMANALRGNTLFMDFYDSPDQVKRLVDFCLKAIRWSMDRQKETVGDFYDGVLTGMDIWLPGNSAGHISEDTAALCSADIYKEFGLPYTKQLTGNYQHMYMHTHSIGIHTIPDIASIPGIDVIEISNDPNSLRAIEVYKQLEDSLRDKIVVVTMTMDEIKDNLDFLRDKKTIIWYNATDHEDAKTVIDFVRRELPIY